MNDELTAVDIKKMEQEVEYRRLQLRPQLLEDVKTAREFGDLSENFEYKAAKREKSRNDSRIRYLERMIKTAKVIDASSNPDEIGLFDKVTIYIEEDDEEQTIELVDHAPPERAQGPHQQGIARRQGRHGSQKGRPRDCPCERDLQL